MPKCPKCGKEIDYLRDFSAVWQEYKMTIDENGDAYYHVSRRKPRPSGRG